jgi:hypothetical protein
VGAAEVIHGVPREPCGMTNLKRNDANYLEIGSVSYATVQAKPLTAIEL